MGPSFLNKATLPLIFDASVAINLNASGCASTILRAIPNAVLVVDAVLDELRVAPPGRQNDIAKLEQLIADGLIQKMSLDVLTQDHFERLVLGNSADTLDDGEAATIAWAVEKRAIAVIDERKAKRICQVRYPKLPVVSTVEVLQLDAIAKALQREGLANAVYNALMIGRMRVWPDQINWVVGLIGDARAAECLSLPAHIRSACRKRLANE
jgi:predicted nucleic acid-binding protein